MKAAKLLAVATVALASLPLMAQQAGANALNGSASAAAVNGPAIDYSQMRPVKGELEHKLDAKSARVGEAVSLKTTEDARTAAGTVIPKGSRLMGHVTEVQAHSKQHESSLIGIEFDRAELKNGQSFAIHSVIESVSQPQWVTAQNKMMDSAAANAFNEIGPNGPAYGGKSMSGTATSSSDLAGNGLVGNAVLSADANGGQMHPAQGTTRALETRATGIPGVMLGGDASGSAGVLSDSKKNVSLLSGTQMVVGIAAAGK
jgi:V8-like Glu-specific endopeptidase